MSKRPCIKKFYEFYLDNDCRWRTKSGIFLSEVITSDTLRLLLMTPYKMLFRLFDHTFCFEVRRLTESRIVVYQTKYLDCYEA